jgi:hypothetical protein
MLRSIRSLLPPRRVAAGLAVCVLLAAGAASGARTFPQNSRQVEITAVADDAIVADGDQLHLAPGVLIFTQTNATVVRGALPSGIIARVQVDLNGDVRQIWMLADDEIIRRPWWLFWRFGQPQR